MEHVIFFLFAALTLGSGIVVPGHSGGPVAGGLGFQQGRDCRHRP